jgi:hypothetical protein
MERLVQAIQKCNISFDILFGGKFIPNWTCLAYNAKKAGEEGR